MLRGACLCSDLAFEADGPLELMHHCHCSICRKSHGASFVTGVGAPESGFRWLRGEGEAVGYRSSPGHVRRFCPRCGSPVPGNATDGRVFLPVGLVEGDLEARAMAHIFVGSKAPWLEIDDGLPAFEGHPPGYDAPEAAPRELAEPVPGALRGSCLCDGVRFLIEAEPERVYHCHCSRCRKARAAAYATNLIVPADAVRFTRGEDLLASYKIPEAERFTSVFCRDCGSKLPRIFREGGMAGRAVVPLGALDDAPALRPQCHIFVASKAPWFEIRDDLPQYDEYAPR